MIEQLLAARASSGQAVTAAIGGFVHITADDAHIQHDPKGRYLYRNYAIMGEDDGWSVWDPRQADREDELGWGSDMENAMSVVDDLVLDDLDASF